MLGKTYVKKILLFLFILFITMVFTNCDLIFPPEETVDLTIVSVEMLKSGDDFTGVRVNFRNNGTKDATGVRFILVLSTDLTIAYPGDYKVYESNTSINAGTTVPVNIDSATQIEPWMTANMTDEQFPPSGTYYAGALIDSDNSISEDDETNNEGVTPDSFLMEGGGGDGGGGDDGSFAIRLTNASDYNGLNLTYGVYLGGITPGADNDLAHGSGIISDGEAEVIAETDSGDTWIGSNGDYDVYMMIDFNGNNEYEDFLDYSISGHIDVNLDENESNIWDYVGSDFSGGPSTHPAEFGIYSESHTVYIEPHFDFSQSVNIDTESDNSASYDGDAVLEAIFTADPVKKIKITYPDDPAILDISDSTYFVFAIDDNFSVEQASPVDQIASFQVNIGGGYVDVDIEGSYMRQFGVGPQDNWDIYAIPLSDFPTFDPTQITGLEIAFPINVATGATLECTLYFDDIYFTDILPPFVGDMPATFGVYSETHTILIEPDWSDGETGGVNYTSTGVTPFDGTYAMQVNFITNPTWIHAGYPDSPTVMNIYASTNIIFALDPTDSSETNLSVILFSPDSGTTSIQGVNVDLSATNTGGYRTAEGQGSGGNWDIYTIPIADLIPPSEPDFDPTQLTSITIGGTNAPCTLYFDDIHFE